MFYQQVIDNYFQESVDRKDLSAISWLLGGRYDILYHSLEEVGEEVEVRESQVSSHHVHPNNIFIEEVIELIDLAYADNPRMRQEAERKLLEGIIIVT